VSNWHFDFEDGNSQMRIWDHNDDEISTSPIDNASSGVKRDSNGIPIDPSFYDAAFEHIKEEHGFQPSAYTQEANAIITLRQVVEGHPDDND